MQTLKHCLIAYFRMKTVFIHKDTNFVDFYQLKCKLQYKGQQGMLPL